MSYSLPHLYVSGTNYEVGKAMGVEFKHRIKQYLENFKEFKSRILPFIQSEKGKKILESYYNLINQNYPWYVEEMRGISEGSNIDFNWIFAINLRVEILHLVKQQSEYSKECSDFYLINNENTLLVHNEDCSPSIYETCYIVSCKITSNNYNGLKSPDEEFTCYCYAGHIPGNAFGFNKHNFVFGVNALSPKNVVLDRFPRQIVTRLMMSCSNLEEFENIILKNSISYGVSVNLGYFGNENSSKLKSEWISEYKDIENKHENKYKIHDNTQLINYEIAPNENDSKISIVSKHCVVKDSDYLELSPSSSSFFSRKFYYHVNCYERIKVEEDPKSVRSSLHRKARIEQIKQPSNLKDLLDMASDDFDELYPIYRSPRPTDSAQTVCTAVFDLQNKTLDIFVKKPSLTYESFCKISMK